MRQEGFESRGLDQPTDEIDLVLLVRMPTFNGFSLLGFELEELEEELEGSFFSTNSPSLWLLPTSNKPLA